VKRNSKRFGSQHGIIAIVDPGALVIDDDRLIMPVAHKNPDHLIALLKQKMRSDAGINASWQT